MPRCFGVAMDGFNAKEGDLKKGMPGRRAVDHAADGHMRRFSMTEQQEEPMLQFFAYEHLPQNLQAVSAPFCTVAGVIAATLPRNPERTAALRKLLEAKDCAVRAALYKETGK